MTFEHDAETRSGNETVPAHLGVRHDTPAGAGGPLSWRDVYTAVRDSEDRVVRAIKEAVSPVWEDVRDQERRLRVMEQGGAGPDHEVRLRVVEKQVDNFVSREKGILSTLGVGKTFVLFLMAIVAPVLSAIIVLIVH